MTQSYLGVVSRRGLEQLVEETEHAAIFLNRRCYRRRTDLALCWATLDTQDAETIHCLLRLRLHTSALWRLDADAIQRGYLPPAGVVGDAA